MIHLIGLLGAVVITQMFLIYLLNEKIKGLTDRYKESVKDSLELQHKLESFNKNYYLLQSKLESFNDGIYILLYALEDDIKKNSKDIKNLQYPKNARKPSSN